MREVLIRLGSRATPPARAAVRPKVADGTDGFPTAPSHARLLAGRASPGTAVRSAGFRDSKDVWWTVFEVQSGAEPGVATGRCLAFESDRVCHTLRDFPANWYDLTSAELAELKARA